MNKAMKDETKALVPRLRFPEFRGAGEWITKELGQVAELLTEKAGDKKFVLMSITAGIGLVSQLEKFGREIAGAQYKNYFVIGNNDFAYNKSATKDYPEGFIALYEVDSQAAVPNSIFTCFRIEKNEIIPRFLKYQFLNNLHGRWLRKFITIGARAHGSLNIDNRDLLALPVPMPNGESSVNEQQKIADCLSSLDTLIAAQADKLDTLKNHKKGLMQQFFPREGETVPRLRFPEFREAGEWKETPLGAFIQDFRKKSSVQDEYEVLTSARYGLVRQKDYYDNVRITGRDNVGFNVIPPGYITYRSRSDDRRFFFNENDLGITGIISTYYPVFSLKRACNKFFTSLLDQSQIKVGMYSVGTSQTVLSLNELKRIRLFFPKINEQQKIADCLSSLDAVITAQAEKLETLKDHKKGLMQQLLPSPDAVSA